MKQTLIIIGLIGLMFWRECLYASRRASLIRHYEQQIEIAIQETSDELLEACETAIATSCNNY